MKRFEHRPLLLRPGVAPPGALSPSQTTYLAHLRAGRSVSELVREFLAAGQLVGFNDLMDLVLRLAKAGLIGDVHARDQILRTTTAVQAVSEGSSFSRSRVSSTSVSTALGRHPFFRSLSPVITTMFARHAEMLELPPGAMLCRQGASERDLYFVMDGEVAVHRILPEGGRRMIGLFGSKAVIGEVGFFLGEPRTADVTTTRRTKVIRVRYHEADFGRIINREAASRLQVRFRVVHALAKSQFLAGLPEEAADPLIFAGRVRSVAEYETLCREGDHGDSFFVVISGSFSIAHGTKNIGVRGAGEAFGEVALFFTQGRRTATVMAQRESTVLEISSVEFYRLLAENLPLACEFEKLAAERLGSVQASAAKAA